MRSYNVTLRGLRPLIMHWDNIEWADNISTFRTRPENKASGVAGDDRSPPFTWIGCVYNDGERVCIPYDNIRACLMAAGKKVPKKGRGSFKSEAVSAIDIDTLFVPLFIDGREIQWSKIEALTEPTIPFSEHVAKVKELGFSLMVKRASVGQSKHVRVRPVFDKWAISFGVTITNDVVSDTVLNDLFYIAGHMVGLGDWRPGAPKSPGPYGKFEAEISKA
jgi:hypothetical protein